MCICLYRAIQVQIMLYLSPPNATGRPVSYVYQSLLSVTGTGYVVSISTIRYGYRLCCVCLDCPLRVQIILCLSLLSVTGAGYAASISDVRHRYSLRVSVSILRATGVGHSTLQTRDYVDRSHRAHHYSASPWPERQQIYPARLGAAGTVRCEPARSPRC